MVGQTNSSMSSSKGSFLSTRGIVVAGILGAIAIFLGATQLGFIPVPTAAGHATIMHVPAILGGVLEGPIVGGIIGLIFGIFSFFDATVPYFKDPLVAILPRILIGIVAYLVYVGLRRVRVPEWVNLAITGFLGSATNTVLVLLMIFLRFHLSLASVISVAVINGLPEAVVSAIITVVVVLAYRGVVWGRRKSKIS